MIASLWVEEGTVVILPDLVYDCLGCGKSCQAMKVEIPDQEYRRLAQSPVTASLEKAGYKPLRTTDEGRFFLGKEAQGRCTYLSPETRCLLHQETGYASKPQTCRDFPFYAVNTPAGVHVGLSFLCTAVARGHGSELESRRPEFEVRFPGGPCPKRWPLSQTATVDWTAYQVIEGHLLNCLRKGKIQGGVARLGLAASEGQLERIPEYRNVNCQAGPALIGLLTFMESRGQSLDRAASVLLALQSGEAYTSRILEGVQIAVGELPAEIPDWFGAESQRYLEHLLFRKTLLEPPDILSRAALIALIPLALIFFAQALAQHHGRNIEKADFYESVGLIEGRLMLHTQGIDDYLRHVGQVFFGPQPDMYESEQP